MRQLESAPITILDKQFEVFGYSDDAWYQEVKTRGSFHEFNLLGRQAGKRAILKAAFNARIAMLAMVTGDA